MGYHKNSFNKVVLTGNIGHEPELKKTAKDVSYLRFGLATTYAFKDTEETTWHNCVAWGNSAEILAEHLAKGQKLQIEGRQETIFSLAEFFGVSVYATVLRFVDLTCFFSCQ